MLYMDIKRFMAGCSRSVDNIIEHALKEHLFGQDCEEVLQTPRIYSSIILLEENFSFSGH